MLSFHDLIDDYVAGRNVLVRSDLNVPLDGDGAITDDGRIRASAPTISELSGNGAQVIVIAHLGRPKGGPDPALSLAPVAARLGELLGAPVRLISAAHWDAGRGDLGMAAGDVVMLENIRFDPRETSRNDDDRAALADELVALAGEDGAFVSDGFGVVHRKQASVYDVAQDLPAYAGGLVLAEVEVLRTLTEKPARPYTVVLGGSKVSDKLAVIEALLPRVDALLVGGGMCFTFLAAQGYGVGGSLLERDQIGSCRRLLESGKIVLPSDVVVADAFAADAQTRTVAADEIPDGWLGLDIGPDSVAAFAEVLAGAKTVFWNGPMGVFELAPFAAGTRGVAQAIVDSGAFSVVGGGDSAAAVRALGLPTEGSLAGPSGGTEGSLAGPSGGTEGSLAGPSGGTEGSLAGPSGGTEGSLAGPSGGTEGSLAGPSGGTEGSLAGPSGGTAGFSHISTGGGASLEYLEGKSLPGLAVLEQ